MFIVMFILLLLASAWHGFYTFHTNMEGMTLHQIDIQANP